MEEDSGTFDPARFLEITFDIMPKVAEELKSIKKDLLQRYSSEKEMALLDYRVEFRKILAKYEPELMEKYQMSMQEYNELAFFNRSIINDYLEKHPELKKHYDSLIRELQLFNPKTNQIPRSNMPPRYPGGINIGI